MVYIKDIVIKNNHRIYDVEQKIKKIIYVLGFSFSLNLFMLFRYSKSCI